MECVTSTMVLRVASQMRCSSRFIASRVSSEGKASASAPAAALAEGRLFGAAVDVYSTEPLPRDNPLLSLDGEGASRLLLTPHIAGVSRQASATLFKVALENAMRALAGETALHRVY